MPRWHGKSHGTRLGYSIFVFICRTMGVLPAYFLLRFVAAYFFVFHRQSSAHIRRYFRHHQGYSAFRAWYSVYKNFYVFGQTLLDRFVIMSGLSNKFSYNFEGEENLHAIVKAGNGGILLSAHVGNWEAAGHLLNRLNTRVNVVMYDGEHERIKHFMESETGSRNFNVIVVKPDLSHVYAIGEALGRNEMICLHADRYVEGTKNSAREFLGAPARFPDGPFALAAAFKVPVSIVFAFKETASHYHLFGSSLIRRDEGEQKAGYTERVARQFVQEVEQKIRLYPEQWFNYYNFWEI